MASGHWERFGLLLVMCITTRMVRPTTLSWYSPMPTLGFCNHFLLLRSQLIRSLSWGNFWLLVPQLVTDNLQQTCSGFLLSYTFFEKQKKKPSQQLTTDVVKGIVYRYIRIAPCFMIVSHYTKNSFTKKIQNYAVINQNFTINSWCFSLWLYQSFSTIHRSTWWLRTSSSTAKIIGGEICFLSRTCIRCRTCVWAGAGMLQPTFNSSYYPASCWRFRWSMWPQNVTVGRYIKYFSHIFHRNMRSSIIISLTLVVLSSIYSGYVGITESFGFS